MAALIAFVPLSRVPLLFLAAPAAQFNYYYAMHLGGLARVRELTASPAPAASGRR